MLTLTPQPLTLNLRTTFRIAHGASDQRHNVILHLHDPQSGLTGLGEAAAVVYHGETQAGILDYLAQIPTLDGDPDDLQGQLDALPPGFSHIVSPPGPAQFDGPLPVHHHVPPRNPLLDGAAVPQRPVRSAV